MKTVTRELNSTIPFTLRNIYTSDGVQVASAASEITEAVVEIQESLTGTPILTLTKTGGRVVASSDLLTFKLIKDLDFTNLEANRIYYVVITLTIGGDETVGVKFKLILNDN